MEAICLVKRGERLAADCILVSEIRSWNTLQEILKPRTVGSLCGSTKSIKKQTKDSSDQFRQQTKNPFYSTKPASLLNLFPWWNQLKSLSKHFYDLTFLLCKTMFSSGAMLVYVRLFPEPVGATIKKSRSLTYPSTNILLWSQVSLDRR